MNPAREVVFDDLIVSLIEEACSSLNAEFSCYVKTIVRG